MTSLFIGALVTVSVAWVNVLFCRSDLSDSDTITSRAKPLWTVNIRAKPSFARIWARAIYDESNEGAPIGSDIKTVNVGLASKEPPEGAHKGVIVITEASGFPYLAMYSERRFYFDSFDYSRPSLVSDVDIGLRIRKAVTTTGLPQDGAWSDQYADLLPIVPISFGFVLDTIFYAVPVGVTIVMYRAGRVALRVHLGRCPACGYRLIGSHQHGCSECGWGRAKGQPESSTTVET